MRRNLFVLSVLTCAVIAAGIAAAEEVSFPYAGRVTAGRVNIRAGSGINYRILKVARKGDIVVVLERAKEWLKIRCPEGCTAWVHSLYLKKEDDGGVAVATGDDVNVRATNSKRSAAVAKLNKGDRVEVVGKKGNWFKIKIPESAVAWIFGEYVEYVDKHDVFMRKIRTIERARALFADLEAELAVARAGGKAEQWDIDFLISGYLEVKGTVALDDLGDVSRDLSAKSNERLIWLTRIKDLRDRLERAKADIHRARDEFERRRRALEVGVPSYTAKGWVEDMGPIWGRPGTHRLMMGGKTMYILRSRTLDLYDYVGSLVGVVGKVSDDSGWNTEVIDVRKIDVLHVGESGL